MEGDGEERRVSLGRRDAHPLRSANNAPYRLHNERGYQGHAHARPLAVLVIMSTQIMRGDWCSMRCLPSGKGTRKNAKGGLYTTCLQDSPHGGYKTSAATKTNRFEFIDDRRDESMVENDHSLLRTKPSRLDVL